MPLKDIITKDTICINENLKVQEAAKILYEKHVGSLVVTETQNGKRDIPIGIITDRDIAIAIGKNSRANSSTTVKEAMNPNVIMASENDGIFETIQKMNRNGIRRLPVINKKDELVGIVTSDDLLQLLGNEIQQLSEIVQTEIEAEAKINKPSNQELRERIARL